MFMSNSNSISAGISDEDTQLVCCQEDLNKPLGDIGSTFRLSLDNPTAHSTC